MLVKISLFLGNAPLRLSLFLCNGSNNKCCFVLLNLFPHLTKQKADNSLRVSKTFFENFPAHEIKKPGSHWIRLFNLAVSIALDKFYFHLVCLHCFV